jgi:hypothetical protein
MAYGATSADLAVQSLSLGRPGSAGLEQFYVLSFMHLHSRRETVLFTDHIKEILSLVLMVYLIGFMEISASVKKDRRLMAVCDVFEILWLLVSRNFSYEA